MSKMLPGLKKNHPWLADAPSNSLVRVCYNLDRALKDSFQKGRGFPKFKIRGKSKDSFYVINQAMRIDAERRVVSLPKLGHVRFRTGRLPEGRIVGANVSRTADAWWLTVQCETDIPDVIVEPHPATVIGVDLGLTDLLVRSDGVRVKAPDRLRKALTRLRRAQRVLCRRKKGSANRARQARRVARIHARVADQRRDALHKATSALVKSATAIVTENPNVKGMVKNRRLAMSFSDAGWGETLRQIGYKAAWTGKTHLKAGRFEPSTQTCSGCGNRRTGADKLPLSMRTYRCAGCGLEIDRDLNAAMNLRRIGLETLCVGQPIIVPTTVGRVTPERGDERKSPNACGESAAWAGASAPATHDFAEAGRSCGSNPV
jgi:putative transposase